MINPQLKLNRPIRYIDLFAGIGGFRLALDSYGAECVFTSEWDDRAAEVYSKNFSGEIHGDITKIPESEVPDHDVLTAGFPCQAFSISGKQLGFNDSRGTLFFDIARIARGKKTPVLILENVKNIFKHDNGNTIKVIKNTLQEIGYDVFIKVLDASDYNVPQKRQRTFIICINRNIYPNTTYSFPKPLDDFKILKDILESSVDEVIYDLGIELNNSWLNKTINFELGGYGSRKTERLGVVKKGGQGDRIYSIYGQAITLSAYGGGTGAKTGLYLINDRVRKLTPRECARLTGMPDSFILHPNRNTNYQLFGNSVVVDVVQSVFESIANTLGWLESLDQKLPKVDLREKTIL